MRRLGIVAVIAACLVPATADAFCGFYVAGSGGKLFNDATQVVLMRMGTRTVLAMQNDYKGPADAFALVVPVPSVLKEADVKTLGKEVFEKVEQMGAPRLVEYWERDPCKPEPDPMIVKLESGAVPTGGAAPTDNLGVKVEAKFTVGEYQIVILSARDSTGLEKWLKQEKYQIPEGAEPLLRPYVEAGSKFFVAKVDPKKVKFVDGRVALSPLRFHYDAEEFALPIRLGLANSSGKQDLIVNILAPRTRFEVTNYKNITIPTNIDVQPAMKSKFAEFYTALFDATIEKHPGAVITEYAWDASTCDPCPGPQLDGTDFATLGADVLEGTREKPTAYQQGDFVLTRLHARYGKELTDDLRFKAAQPIVGGREHVHGDKGKLEEGSRPDSINNFQGRYAIRYPWTAKIDCPNPIRGRWGGPPDGQPQPQIQPATKLAFAPRGGVQLPDAVAEDIPELGVVAKVVASVSGTPAAVQPTTTPPPSSPPGPSSSVTKNKSGCGCQAVTSDFHGLLVLAFGAAWLRRRRRPALYGERSTSKGYSREIS